MKITVSYAELKSFGGYSNKRAEASVEVDVHENDLETAYETAWSIVKEQVKRQLEPHVNGDSYDKLRRLQAQTDEVPF